MNPEVAAQQLTDVKKVGATQQIASECHLHCFGTQPAPDCLEHCYDNMLTVFNGCLAAMKEAGKQKNSRYMRLVFGTMEDRLERVERFNEMRPSMQGNPDFYLERDYFDLTKDT